MPQTESHGERIAVLEAQMRNVVTDQHEIKEGIADMRERFTRYEAKWGGVLMVLTAIGSLLLTFKDTFLAKFK